jgi:hypothetical protein
MVSGGKDIRREGHRTGRASGRKGIKRQEHPAEVAHRTLGHGALTALCPPSMVVESAPENKADFVEIRLCEREQKLVANIMNA